MIFFATLLANVEAQIVVLLVTFLAHSFEPGRTESADSYQVCQLVFDFRNDVAQLVDQCWCVSCELLISFAVRFLRYLLVAQKAFVTFM